MDEIWKDIEGYEVLYSVSNLGRVKSMGIKHRHNYGRYATKPVKMLSQRPNGRGYATVRLSRDTKARTFRTHRLVACAFLPNPNNYGLVNHIDGNKLNNKVSNLEWCSPKQNVEHAWRTGLAKKVRSYQEIANRVGCILNYVPHDVQVVTPIGLGRVLIGEKSLKIIYANDKTENLILAIRRYGDCLKLKLRSLSSLCEPLEDGSVPIVELAKMAFPKRTWELRKSGCWSIDMKFIYDKYNTSFSTLCEDGGAYSDGLIVHNQLDLFNYLFQHHFDVYGLIDKDLANKK